MDRKVKYSASNQSNFILLISVFLIIFSSGCTSSSSSGNLTEAVDGDTVKVKIQDIETIRLIGIDSPELTGEVNPKEFGFETTERNRECLQRYAEKAEKEINRYEGSEVLVYQDNLQEKRGGYGRKLAYLYHQNHSVSLNEMLLQKGLARYFSSEFGEANRFREIERRARVNEKGLWSCG